MPSADPFANKKKRKKKEKEIIPTVNEQGVVSPVYVVTQFKKKILSEGDDLRREKLLKGVKLVKEEYGLNNNETVCLIHEAFIDPEKVEESIIDYAYIFAKFAKKSAQQKKILMWTFNLVKKHKDLLPRYSVYLLLFYKEGLIDAETTVSWYEKREEKTSEFNKNVLEVSQPFLTWLKSQ